MYLVCSHMAHHLTKVLLDMPYDATEAFRVYRLDYVPREFWRLVRSIRHSFFIESLFVLHSNRFLIIEVPIALPARTKGVLQDDGLGHLSHGWPALETSLGGQTRSRPFRLAGRTS